MATSSAQQRFQASIHMINSADPAEKALLGLILQDGRRYFDAAAYVKPEDFTLLRHCQLFMAMAEIAAERRTPDMIAVDSKLRGRGEITTDSFDDMSFYLTELVSSAGGDIEEHARLIASVAYRRRLAGAGDRITAHALATQKTDASAISAEAMAMLMEADQGRVGSDDPVSLNDAYQLHWKDIEATAGKTGVSGLATGFKDYDLLTDGFQQGSVNIFAGRPGMGKTSASTNIGLGVAEGGGIVYDWSGEQTVKELTQKYMSSLTHVSSIKLRRGWRPGGLEQKDYRAYVDASEKVMKLNIFMDSTTPMTVPALIQRANKIKRRKGLDLIIVDYVQLLRSVTDFGANETAALTEISRDIKDGLAKVAPVLLLAQLNRSVEQRQNKRPMLSDLRQSGSLEQDADTITFLYREGYYDSDCPTPDLTEWILAKNRHGETGMRSYLFRPGENRFYNTIRMGVK